MKITRDTIARKMGLNLVEGMLHEQHATFNADGTLKDLTLTVSDQEKFNYNVTVTRAEVDLVLTEYAEKNASCPF